MSAHLQPQPLTPEEKERYEALKNKTASEVTLEEFFDYAELHARMRITKT